MVWFNKETTTASPVVARVLLARCLFRSTFNLLEAPKAEVLEELVRRNGKECEGKEDIPIWAPYPFPQNNWTELAIRRVGGGGENETDFCEAFGGRGGGGGEWESGEGGNGNVDGDEGGEEESG